MSSSMDDDFPQECIASIIIYVPNFDNGMKDATPFNAISRAVKSELDNYVQTEDKYFQFLFGDFGDFPVPENPKYSAFVFRLECYIGNDTK